MNLIEKSKIEKDQIEKNQLRKKKYAPYFLCAALLLFIVYFKDVLSILRFTWKLIFPFVLGGGIAFLLSVPMHFIESYISKIPKIKQKLARGLSLFLTLLLIFAVIILVFFIVIPELANTFISIGKQIPKAYDQFVHYVDHFAIDWPGIQKTLSTWNWDSITEKLVKFAQTGASGIFDTSISVLSSIVNGVTVFFIGFVFALYVLLQKETLARHSAKLVIAVFPPRVHEKIFLIGKLTHKTFSSFISGQCFEAVLLGSFFFLMMSILQFPYAMLIGIVIAFTALIPMIGAFIGCGIGAFLIVMVNPTQALWFIVLFLIIQQLEGNLVYPHIVGNSIGLPSIWVLVAVFIGGSLMGIVGMLIFIPLSSVLYTLLRGWTNHRLEQKKVPAIHYEQPTDKPNDEMEKNNLVDNIVKK